jgi:hypothetical protein
MVKSFSIYPSNGTSFNVSKKFDMNKSYLLRCSLRCEALAVAVVATLVDDHPPMLARR